MSATAHEEEARPGLRSLGQAAALVGASLTHRLRSVQDAAARRTVYFVEGSGAVALLWLDVSSPFSSQQEGPPSPLVRYLLDFLPSDVLTMDVAVGRHHAAHPQLREIRSAFNAVLEQLCSRQATLMVDEHGELFYQFKGKHIDADFSLSYRMRGAAATTLDEHDLLAVLLRGSSPVLSSPSHVVTGVRLVLTVLEAVAGLSLDQTSEAGLAILVVLHELALSHARRAQLDAESVSGAMRRIDEAFTGRFWPVLQWTVTHEPRTLNELADDSVAEYVKLRNMHHVGRMDEGLPSEAVYRQKATDAALWAFALAVLSVPETLEELGTRSRDWRNSRAGAQSRSKFAPIARWE
ncbi:hypothetical protein Rhopal_006825-T1 [Rhodotorula paludigena]|uniref:Uncharacterized protein n=1 Tax=Rhodotorula paludigena TaxID=86838 RepID=A0AAV5GU71_9BASI|nr:hypothetical protein Rhopal_006825-T1 [Rhodotorula paludigena]